MDKLDPTSVVISVAYVGIVIFFLHWYIGRMYRQRFKLIATLRYRGGSEGFEKEIELPHISQGIGWLDYEFAMIDLASKLAGQPSTVIASAELVFADSGTAKRYLPELKKRAQALGEKYGRYGFNLEQFENVNHIWFWRV